MVMVEVQNQVEIETEESVVIDGTETPVPDRSDVEAAALSPPEDEVTGRWFYSVPFPGVRYYGLDQSTGTLG